MNDMDRLKAAAFHDAVPLDGLMNPHILTMFHVSDDETICLGAEARPDTNDMTIDNGDFELTLSFAEIDAWIGCLERVRDLLLYHRVKGGA